MKFYKESTLVIIFISCLRIVDITHYLIQNDRHFVVICMVCWTMEVGPTSNQLLQFHRADEQNDVGSKLVKTSDCYLGCKIFTLSSIPAMFVYIPS